MMRAATVIRGGRNETDWDRAWKMLFPEACSEVHHVE
jgi:hypothetical protein